LINAINGVKVTSNDAAYLMLQNNARSLKK